MNIAVIKHQPNAGAHYLFSVPEGVKLKAGDLVMCQTRHGEAYGWLAYDSFEVEGAALEALCRAHGAKTLKPIVGIYELSSFEKTEHPMCRCALQVANPTREIVIKGNNAKAVTVTMNAQITDVIREPDSDPCVSAKRTAAEYARCIKDVLNVDDVVVTDLKVFIHDGQERV